MRAFLFLLLLLPLRGVAAEIRLEVGGPQSATAAALKQLGAVDTTPRLEVVGPHGEQPLHDLYWSVPEFELVLVLTGYAKTESLGPIGYWTEKDFNFSKVRRDDTKQYALCIVFDTDKKTYMVAAPQRDWIGTAFEDTDPATTLLRIEYRSVGCFQSVDYEFTFQFLSNHGLKVSAIENVYQPTTAFTGTINRVTIGSVTLNGYDSDRFSKLLEYYKSFAPSDTFSTTKDRLIFEKVTGEKAVVLAKIEDHTGRLRERLDVMTFDEIVERIHPVDHPLKPPDDSVSPPHPK